MKSVRTAVVYGSGCFIISPLMIKYMYRYLLSLVILSGVATMLSCHAQKQELSVSGFAFEDEPDNGAGVDEFGRPYIIVQGDTVHAAYMPGVFPDGKRQLTDKDYVRVAEALGVEPAAIKAVVSIEAGATHRGFYEEGKPVINFDLSVFRKMASRRGVNLGKYSKSHRVVFNRPNVARYGSYQRAQQARLDAAMTIDSVAAVYGTFWGMFQIGGFNWKRCGTESPAEFVRRMSLSEQEQLELFAGFICNSGLLESLRRKDWRSFARGYNGPSYAARGYHTRLANAYSKFKKEFQ